MFSRKQACDDPTWIELQANPDIPFRFHGLPARIIELFSSHDTLLMDADNTPLLYPHQVDILRLSLHQLQVGAQPSEADMSKVLELMRLRLQRRSLLVRSYTIPRRDMKDSTHAKRVEIQSDLVAVETAIRHFGMNHPSPTGDAVNALEIRIGSSTSTKLNFILNEVRGGRWIFKNVYSSLSFR